MNSLAHHLVQHFQGVILVTWLPSFAVGVVRSVHAAPTEALAIALDVGRVDACTLLLTGSEWVATTIIKLG